MTASVALLSKAEACGAVITGKPDGSEPITIVFSIKAWQAFDAALMGAQPAQATPALVKLFDMPLGTRFRYPGNARVYVLIDRSGIGLIADAPDTAAPKWHQGMYCVTDDTTDMRTLMVEFVPVQEATSAKSVTIWERSDDSPLQA